MTATLPDPGPGSAFGSSRFAAWLAAEVIALAVLAVSMNSLSAPFVFDDEPSIVANPTIRSLWPLTTALSPPSDMTVSGRPVLNLSFAVNYALGGLDVRGYRAANVAIHVLAALTLFGIVRRTLERLKDAAACADPWPAALAVAVIWAVHPLQTESVTYVVQRAESLMGLLYLLTLYCFIRAAGAARPGRWLGASAAACLVGMATKEVMVSAPLAVLLYDRTFVAGGLRGAWRARRGYYLGLAATWLLLAGLVLSTHGRGDTIGFDVGIGWGSYLLVQVRAVAHYLRLAVWPAALIFEYGPDRVNRAVEVAPAAVVVGSVLAGSLACLRLRPALWFLGVCFFMILAPSSTVPGVRQMIAEHRMYLPLAAVVAAAVLAGWRVAGRRSLLLWVALAAGFGLLTVRRNETYGSQLSLWADTVVKRPGNPYARNNYANVLLQAGRNAEARAQLAEALRLKPDYADAHNNLGNALTQAGEPSAAVAQYREAIRLEPGRSVRVHNNLGVALYQTGDLAGAMEQFQEALRDDAYPDAHNNLGNVYFKLGRLPEALGQFQAAVRLRPDYAEAHETLGRTLIALGREREGRAELDEAARLMSLRAGAAAGGR